MRGDIHSPSNFDPAAYEYVGSFDNWPPPGAYVSDGLSEYDTAFGVIQGLTYDHATKRAALRLIEESGAKVHFQVDGASQCDHCGAHIRYVSIFKHSNGEYIAVGDTCAEERFGCNSRREFDIKRLREAAATARERERAFGKAVEFIETAAPELRDWMLSPAAQEVGGIFADMSRKLVKYGSLSEKQVAFARRLLQEHYERQRNGGKSNREIEIEQERESAQDCPSGRIEIVGTVIKLAESESDFGVSWKLTVKDDRGFLVWVTCPATLDVSRGDRVQMTVTVEPSLKDAKFGFGKRPSKARVVG